jgi:hypothetical protein
MSGGLDPLQYSHEARTSIGSSSSLYSNDSGYGSRTDSRGNNSPGTATKPEKTFFSGLASKFKNQRTSLSPFEKLGEMTSILTLTKFDTSAAETSVAETNAAVLPATSITRFVNSMKK